MGVAQKLQSMFTTFEEHGQVSPKPPFIAFRRCKHLKDILVRSTLYSGDSGVCGTKECTPCDKSRCQVCVAMCNTDTFKS